ncbi:Flp family type IVb pilin [Vibrio hannami]|uniref:Flp family type IVb pilin n=1 Tax=Vibrio hannami TaxID=2717094 RepID=UPI00240EC7E4|nr:Flp family type IVb pilin [Vibrio hannami]MDG3087326.1 Flp family type IVb pilin [Vibrio hannami]
MSKLINLCKEFMKDEEGLTVVEYVVGAALLVVGLAAIFSGLGDDLSTKLNETVTGIGSSSTDTTTAN